MVKIVFAVIALLFIVMLIKQKGVKKLPWFFAAILFFPPNIVLIETPHMPFSRLMIYVLLIVTIAKEKGWYQSFKTFPLKIPLVILFLSLLCVGLFDERITLFFRIYRPITYFVENFFVLFLSYHYLRSVKDAASIYNTLIVFFILLSLYGISNFLTKQNEYNSFVTSAYGGRDNATDYMVTGTARFRVASFTWHPIYYGLIVSEAIMLMSLLLNAGDLFKKKTIIYIALPLLLINLFLVNSRTPLLALLCALAIYFIFAVNLSGKIRIMVFVIVFSPIALVLTPTGSKIIESTLSILSGRQSNEDKTGSSLNMRETQLNASISIFNKNPVFGNGFQYITENLGYSNDTAKRRLDKDLLSFESYSFLLLIEQGLCGIIGNLILFITLFLWLARQYLIVNPGVKKYVIFCVSITVLFLIFILGTGDLGSFPFFMSLLGLGIKLIVLQQKGRIVNVSFQDLNKIQANT